MHLLYITFGSNLKNHTQAYFSIFSFLVHKQIYSSINIITDNPRYYKSIKNHINLIEVDQAILQDWQGPYNFFWRIKIKGIESVCNKYSGEPVLYLDSDTFLYNTEKYSSTIIAGNHAVMCDNEGPLLSLKSKTMKTMARNLKGVEIAGLNNLSKYHMWNAGVVLVPNNVNGKDMHLALTLCDKMCNLGVTDQFIEQFSLSVALQHVYGLKPAADFIAHYWSNKDEWDSVIKNFFIENKMMELSFEEELERFAQIDFSKYPVTRIVKNTNRRLKTLVDKTFTDKKTVYLQK